MFTRNATMVTLAAGLLLHPAVSGAQGPPQSVNPEAIEVDFPLLVDTGIAGYRLELFADSADTMRDAPVKSMEIGVSTRTPEGRLRVELKDLVLDVPNGRVRRDSADNGTD